MPLPPHGKKQVNPVLLQDVIDAKTAAGVRLTAAENAASAANAALQAARRYFESLRDALDKLEELDRVEKDNGVL